MQRDEPRELLIFTRSCSSSFGSEDYCHRPPLLYRMQRQQNPPHAAASNMKSFLYRLFRSLDEIMVLACKFCLKKKKNWGNLRSFFFFHFSRVMHAQYKAETRMVSRGWMYILRPLYVSQPEFGDYTPISAGAVDIWLLYAFAIIFLACVDFFSVSRGLSFLSE